MLRCILCYILPDLAPKLEAVGNGLGRAVYLDLDSVHFMFLDTKAESRAAEANDLDWGYSNLGSYFLFSMVIQTLWAICVVRWRNSRAEIRQITAFGALLATSASEMDSLVRAPGRA